ncbi:MAG: phosphotransferase, partial [bacterium]
MSSHDTGPVEVDAVMVSRLLQEQFPHLAGRTVTAIPSAGAGNALFRLGDDLLVRLPRHRGTVMAIGIELKWLPWLARQLPLAIPVPVAAGAASATFTRPWAIFEWHDGAPVDSDPE